LDQKRQAKAVRLAYVFRQKPEQQRMDFYDISTAAAMSISLVCIVWLYLLIKREPQKTLFGKPIPSNLMPILIILFVVAGVVTVVFKPAPLQYVVIEPTGEIEYKY
jgi:hypothetical protein